MRFFLVLALAIVIVVWFYMRFKSRHEKGSQWLPPGGTRSPQATHRERVTKKNKSLASQALAVVSPEVFLSGDATYRFKVAGVSHYQDAIRSIAGTEGLKGKEVYCDAVIVHELNNLHDKNACSVTIGRHKVGYMFKGDAKDLVIGMNAKGEATGFTVGCKALINGGWVSTDGYKGKYGVTDRKSVV